MSNGSGHYTTCPRLIVEYRDMDGAGQLSIHDDSMYLSTTVYPSNGSKVSL